MSSAQVQQPRPARTPYQLAIQDEVEKVELGDTTTYAAIAERIGGSGRSVSVSMSKADFEADGIAWWRVVRSNGTVGPPDLGATITATQRLIEEGVAFTNGGRVAKWAGSASARTSRPVKQEVVPEPCKTDGCSQQWQTHAGPCD